MLDPNISAQVSEILTSLAMGAISLAAAYAVQYMKKMTAQAKEETKQIQNEEQRHLVQAALDRLDDVAEKTVTAIEQTTAKQLRAAVKEGTGSQAELEALAGEAMKQIVQTLEPEYLTLLSQTLGDIDTYLSNVVEAKVFKVKGAA